MKERVRCTEGLFYKKSCLLLFLKLTQNLLIIAMFGFWEVNSIKIIVYSISELPLYKNL